ARLRVIRFVFDARSALHTVKDQLHRSEAKRTSLGQHHETLHERALEERAVLAAGPLVVICRTFLRIPTTSPAVERIVPLVIPTKKGCRRCGRLVATHASGIRVCVAFINGGFILHRLNGIVVGVFLLTSASVLAVTTGTNNAPRGPL